MLLLGGCSSGGYDWRNLAMPFERTSYPQGKPQVADCGLIAISTPTMWQCGDKKYSSLELADIRNKKPLPPAPTISVPRGGIQEP
jgi:hypothetical protein